MQPKQVHYQHVKLKKHLFQEPLPINIKEIRKSKVGQPAALFEQEKLSIKQHAFAISDFGFLFDTYDLWMLVKFCQDKKGMKAQHLVDNFLGAN